ncbi:uncharacterized protein LOC134191436 [Corticium candelabrum]|uniref:uncharacterized protein LOC134191436 n=1 Tax=Corticium candelabrum TaxID=121492 RepID=UPI002E2730AC|nr:uncharacterized protein LOC134191436 [Corticium candelabrum]
MVQTNSENPDGQVISRIKETLFDMLDGNNPFSHISPSSKTEEPGRSRDYNITTNSRAQETAPPVQHKHAEIDRECVTSCLANANEVLPNKEHNTEHKQLLKEVHVQSINHLTVGSEPSNYGIRKLDTTPPSLHKQETTTYVNLSEVHSTPASKQNKPTEDDKGTSGYSRKLLPTELREGSYASVAENLQEQNHEENKYQMREEQNMSAHQLPKLDPMDCCPMPNSLQVTKYNLQVLNKQNEFPFIVDNFTNIRADCSIVFESTSSGSRSPRSSYLLNQGLQENKASLHSTDWRNSYCSEQHSSSMQYEWNDLSIVRNLRQSQWPQLFCQSLETTHNTAERRSLLSLANDLNYIHCNECRQSDDQYAEFEQAIQSAEDSAQDILQMALAIEAVEPE